MRMAMMIMVGIIPLQLLEMFNATIYLHLETLAWHKVTVNSEAAVVGQQSSSPLSVWFYKAWAP